jgi:endonuclease/exonuclease/phosphatase family metal-dependent hydrolase
MQFKLLLLLLFICGCVTMGKTLPDNPAMGQIFKVLTINLCADWNAPRPDRAAKIVETVKAENIDIILFQEGIKGIGQFDMAKSIATQLGYSYVQVPAFGVPGFLEYCIGIISRYPISSIHSAGCQVSGGDPIDKMPFPGSTRGILVKINNIWIMTSHLTVPVVQSEKEKQVRCLASDIPAGVCIWGGDFNFGRTDPAYSLIPMMESIYPGNPQVDMMFSRGLKVIESKLMFTDHYVSDHDGVMVTYKQGE